MLKSMHKKPFAWLVLPLLLAAGCQEKQSESKPAPAPKVVVAEATTETVPLYLQLTGRTESPNTVDIIARVDGHITSRGFTEGTDVNKGDRLFVIDQRPYQSELARVQAETNKNSAALDYAQKEVQRYTVLARDGTEPPEQLDEKTANANEAQGDLDSSKADVESAQINLGFTTVTAPIDGRVGRVYRDIGNVITADETVLVELVQMEPLYVYVSPSERQYLDLRTYQTGETELPVTIELIDGSQHPHTGKLDFSSPGVDPSTGTIAIRASFPNPDKTLKPGQYASVRIELTRQANQITVPAEAVGQDQAGFYVFVVDKDGKATTRRITAGRLYEGRRLIEKGLKAGETVIVQGLQKVRNGMTVTPEKADAGNGASS